MLKKILFLSAANISGACVAADTLSLHHAPLSSLNGFPVIDGSSQNKSNAPVQKQDNALQTVSKTNQGHKTITRYQQLYKGVPVFGAQVTVVKSEQQGLAPSANSLVNGSLTNDIKINTTPGISSKRALEAAKTSFFGNGKGSEVTDEQSQLQIRAGADDTLELVYLVSFKTISQDSIPKWPFFIVNAATGEVTRQWNNIKNHQDTGPGGNEKVHEYWYGKDGLPALDVMKNDDICTMESKNVRLVNLNMIWDRYNTLLNAWKYPCGSNVEENINGAFSPMNDAYYFGQTIVDMYQQWYGLNALQNNAGRAIPLIMRVHYGVDYDNAFWDGRTMTFGDGKELYPLVSLDVAGHEVTHGFTEQHSGLEYHDESGALNESMSDMAGQASRAFLLETQAALYNKAYMQPNKVTWGIGETIVRDSSAAMRYMDRPSKDGSSADCLDKTLANQSGGDCVISYGQLVSYANAQIEDEEDRQGFIVHTASGIFNKAFYLMSQKMGIKSAFKVMLLANTDYWTPDTDFRTAACGVLYAASDLNANSADIKSIFNQVGIDTEGCFKSGH